MFARDEVFSKYVGIKCFLEFIGIRLNICIFCLQSSFHEKTAFMTRQHKNGRHHTLVFMSQLHIDDSFLIYFGFPRTVLGSLPKISLGST